MPYYPNPAGGSMYAANQQAAQAQGWTPSMGTFGSYSTSESGPPPGSGGNPGGNPGNPGNPGDYFANTSQADALMTQAQNSAYQAYLNSKLALDTDAQAFSKAQAAFTNAITAAGVTGMYQGQPTFPAMQSYSQMFGTYAMPTPGQQTLAAQQQAFQQGVTTAGLTGQYQGAQTQQAQQQAFQQALAAAGLTGQYQGAPTQQAQQQAFSQQIAAQAQALAQWQAQQGASQNYLTLLSNLRGPANYAQYQKVLGSTPGGIQDLVRAAAGQYIPGGGATTGVAPTPVSLQSFVGSATGPADTSTQAAMGSLVAPNQMAPQTWNALTPSQQQMLLGTWESQGYTQDDARALFNQSLPKYATGAQAAGSFRLQ